DTEKLVASAPEKAGEGFVRTELVKSGPDELSGLIATLTDQMMQASAELKFELAAKIRDEVLDLKRELREMVGARG
ncbi:MAG: UvrB/UvrC motif-containing protein, partial [Pontimonas sp.]